MKQCEDAQKATKRILIEQSSPQQREWKPTLEINERKTRVFSAMTQKGENLESAEGELFANSGRLTGTLPTHHEILRFPTVDDAKEIRTRVINNVFDAIKEGSMQLENERT